MYALQTKTLSQPHWHPKESNWQDYHCYTAVQLPIAVRQWLLDCGSLTQRLVRASKGDFKVKVLHQQWQRPRLSEAKLLGMRAREMAIVREVALICEGQPWVFARSVIPASSIKGRLRILRQFDDSPLGAMLFKDPTMRRAPFQLATVDGQCGQIPNALQQPSALWGRRSRFELSGKPLMVSEIFLPSFKP